MIRGIDSIETAFCNDDFQDDELGSGKAGGRREQVSEP